MKNTSLSFGYSIFGYQNQIDRFESVQFFRFWFGIFRFWRDFFSVFDFINPRRTYPFEMGRSNYGLGVSTIYGLELDRYSYMAWGVKKKNRLSWLRQWFSFADVFVFNQFRPVLYKLLPYKIRNSFSNATKNSVLITIITV